MYFKMLEVVQSGFEIVKAGITFISGEPLLMVPVGLALGGSVISIVKSKLTM